MANQTETNPIVAAIIIIVMLVIVYGILGYIVEITWNYTLPVVIPGVGRITFYQAIALFILASLLFGGAGSCSNACKSCYNSVAGSNNNSVPNSNMMSQSANQLTKS